MIQVGAPGLALVALALGGALAASASPAHAAAFVPPAPGRHEARIPIQPPQTVYPLGTGFVLAGSDTASVRGRVLVRGRDYFLDAISGEFRLNTILAAGDTVRVVYRALLTPPPATYLARGARPPAPPVAPAPGGTAAIDSAGRSTGLVRPGTMAASGTSTPGLGTALELAGNKSVALDFGNNRDVALRQSLDLNVSGRLAPEVEVLAVLSDRNTPLTTEGGTRELAELDRILLEVKGPHAAGLLGDWTLRQERGEFARIARELTGVEARGGSEDLGGRAALASVKGRFVSRQFPGVEGLQGPYLLPDDNGATGVAIVVGSEQVWLDGERLDRGEAADYAMDYERGTITFTARRLISASSRIAVDYQVALTAYHRTLSALAGQGRRGGLTTWGHYLKEGDAADRPLAFSLDESDRFALENAPDSATFAVGAGVSPGPGDYDAINDSAGVTTHFAFAGFEQGDFRVSFAPVGVQRGDYAESTQVGGRAVFRFVGAGNGTHVVGRRLPLPSSLSVLDGGLAWAPNSWARVQGEVARSSARANTLSRTGEARDGTAGTVRAEAAGAVKLLGRSLGRFGAVFSVRRFDDAFRSPGRIDPAFAEEDWGVSADRPLTAQDRRGAAVTWGPRSALELGAEYAELEADGDFFASRRRATVRTTGPVAVAGRLERVDNRRTGTAAGTNDEGFRNKATLAAVYGGWKWLKPEASLDFEDRLPPGATDSAAVRYRAFNAGASVPALGPVELVAHAGVRSDAVRRAGDWTPWTRAVHGRAQATGRFGTRVTSALGVERRVRTPDAPGAPVRQATDLGYARLRQELGGRLGEHEASFEWTGEAVEQRLRQVRFVGAGSGAYDSLGNFTGRGDYDVVLVATGTFDRIAKTSGSYRLELRPGAALAESSAAGRLFGDARISMLAQASAGRRGGFTAGDLFYTPKRLLSREDIAFGTYTIRPEVQFGGRTRFAQFLFRLERRSSADRQFAGSRTLRDEWSEEARWRTRPGPRWLSEVVLRLGQGTAEQSSGGGFAARRRLVTRAVSAEATWLPKTEWRVGAVGSVDQADVEDDAVAASRVVRLGPRLVWSRGGRLR
ncbi:MAG: hypothetical protein ABIP29_00135, partial [Candidatus Eisenbacteria bacterium]